MCISEYVYVCVRIYVWVCVCVCAHRLTCAPYPREGGITISLFPPLAIPIIPSSQPYKQDNNIKQ